MSTGIVLYSYTGHTQKVIEKLADQMENRPSIFTLEPVRQINLSDLKTPIKSIPNIAAYDTVILATSGARRPHVISHGNFFRRNAGFEE